MFCRCPSSTAGSSACCLGLSGLSTTVDAQKPSSLPKVAGASAQAEGSWPHVITAGGASVTVYQPQVIAWPEHKTLRARAAISVQPAGQAKPILGTVNVEGTTETDLATRSVLFSDPKLITSRFPSLDTEQAMRLDTRIKAALAEMGPKRVPLETVLLSLDEKPTSTPDVRNEPPTIFYSDHPARLVVFDGEPVLAPVGSTGLSVAVNTNWDVFSDPNGKSWYLLDNGGWLTANDYKGPWSPAPSLPASFQSLPADPNFAQVRKSIPGRKLVASEMPTIFVSTVPAELIVTRGPPAFAPIRGTSLRAVSNTDATLINDPATNLFYYLVSGRWFSAAGLEGPWTFATPSLPADFARIPPDGPPGTALASVPGTAQAQEAVLQAQIPQQATLQRAQAKLEVKYAGAPQFKPIEGTDMAYALNTNVDVLKIGDVYYACLRGAWFKASSPTGPWSLADSVPSVVRTIPPSNPLYPVTYVQVYAATPTTVTYGYTSGYMMGFVTAGVLAYGTGYYYPPVIVPGPVPAYFPYPYSYAAGVRYNPYTGVWARGGSVYGPNGGAGAWSAYNPSMGTYSHGSGVWGPYGGTGHAAFYNPRPALRGAPHRTATCTAAGDRALSAGRTPRSTRKAEATPTDRRARSAPAPAPKARACMVRTATMPAW
jgi:hypothetical protein